MPSPKVKPPIKRPAAIRRGRSIFWCPIRPAARSISWRGRSGDELSTRWHQAVVIENRPGAGGVIAEQALAQSPPDGYTLIVVATGHALNSFFYSSLPYDTFKDFTPLSLIGSSPNMLLVRAGSPYKTVADVIAAARAKPGQLSYGHAGNGTSSHLAGELFKAMAKIDIPQCPTRAAARRCSIWSAAMCR